MVKAGEFDVRIAYSAHGNRATNVRVTLKNGELSKIVRINQRKAPGIDGLFESIGQFELNGAVEIVIDNEGADGHVIVDAVQLLAQ